MATFDELEAFKLTGVNETGRELGKGAYAIVQELEFMKMKCAGKKLHEVLLDQGRAGYSVRRFAEECSLLSQVRHPNIVQFLGVHFQRGVRAPILVMEYLPTNLTSCIEQHGILPNEISYSILHDVALGLCYLHSQTPPIIHRDLSSNNVLLTANMTAKISDLGVARIFNLTPLQVSHMTQTPGTPAYMPPEVMVANPKYDTSVDEFSYGILMIHMFSGRWPEPQVGPNRIDGDQLIPVSEAERREVFLQVIGSNHPVMDLILRCINNNPQRRAHAGEIVEQLAAMTLQFPDSFTNRLEMLRHIDIQEQDRRTLAEEKEKAASEIEQREQELAALQQQLECSNVSQASGMEQLRQLQERLSAQKGSSSLTYALLEKELADSVAVRESAIRRKEDEIAIKDRDLKKKEDMLTQANEQLTRLREHLAPIKKTTKACITWKKHGELPEKISGGQATIIGGRIYCGGQDSEHSTSCYMYDQLQGKWIILSPLPVELFGVGQVCGKLVAVGGQRKTDDKMRVSNEVFMYDERSRKWKHTIQPITIVRFDPGVLSLPFALVVAGGQTDLMRYTNTVEILKHGEKPEVAQWCTTNPLPIDCSRLSLVADNTTCYALGGARLRKQLNQALYASLDDILHTATPPHQNSHDERDSGPTQSAWKALPPTLSYNPAATILAGTLIAVGGWEKPVGGERRKEVYVYSPSTESWLYISDLPVPLARSIVATSSSQLFVIGGYKDGGNVRTVYTGMLAMDV